MQPGNRVILNTAILYAKMVVSILVGLISTRLVLKALGVEDYGIYNLVAGVVSMLAFLNTSLAASTQRFLSFSLGKQDVRHLKKIFYYSLILHIGIGVCVILLIETVGIYGIKHVLTIAPDKISNTLSILHLLSCSVFFSIVAVPYIAVLISRENMLLLSLIEIAETVLKLLGAVYLLTYPGNRLIMYSAIIVAVMIISLLLKMIICRMKYPETRIVFQSLNDRTLLRELTSFAGWYTFASVGSMGRGQGIPMILNVFFGVVVNAAYGIANQVNGLMQFFATAILQSIRPQIIKSEGAQDRIRVKKLSLVACRYMFFLCALISIPLIIEMPYVLHLWLGNPPEYTVGFCRLVLLSTLLFMITCGLGTAIDATGNIKWMYIWMGSLHFLNLPVGYFLLKAGMSAYSVLWVVVGEELICMWVRIYLANRIVGISVRKFVRRVIVPITIVTGATVLAGIVAIFYMHTGFLRLVVTSMLCTCTFLITGWFCGIENEEKSRFKNIMHNITAQFKLVKR